MLRLIALAVGLALTALPPSAGALDQRLARMATGSLAGAYFPVGVALCRLVNETRREHGIRCSAQPSEGSVANIEALRAGAADFAIVQSDVQNAAMRGGGVFAGEPAFEDLRAVMSLHPEPLTVVARADAGIERFEDLFGKRISYGNPGSGQRALWDTLAGRMGWTPASFTAALELDPDQQAAALCDGRIDAFVFAIGHPAPSILEATSGCDAVLVPVTGPRISALVSVNPFYFETDIPGGLYRGNPDDVPTFGVGATLVTRADVADDVVATLFDSVFGNIETLRGLDPVLSDLDPREMATDGLTAPLHPAAEAILSRQGLDRIARHCGRARTPDLMRAAMRG